MDRDGVVNEQIIDGYVMESEQFVYTPHFLEAMKLLRPRFARIILITNQQCVGKGLCTMEDIDHIHDRMQGQLLVQGTPFDKIYCCPHLASESCACRKPNIGLAMQAQRDFPDIDFKFSRRDRPQGGPEGKADVIPAVPVCPMLGHAGKIRILRIGLLIIPEDRAAFFAEFDCRPGQPGLNTLQHINIDIQRDLFAEIIERTPSRNFCFHEHDLIRSQSGIVPR